MRIPLLALLPVALGTLASLANAHFTDDVDAREIHARRSFQDDLALERRDIIASLSTRDLIDTLSERLEQRAKPKYEWHCECNRVLTDNVLLKFSSDSVWSHETKMGHRVYQKRVS
ncbi:hypothetical protein DFP72DRAFT_634956 [Ephemerocybe angulata]|uniref:Uncharacterized protein n=1 Tax=Ephemerocybe angulata TaxID=980116 RepID=A0A8H6LY90_9AGAR|nr:hypothetical protein DFP72DRAFT_634956 [Tulosesus angulatus]